ncbi:unnamed protein product [Cyclocybe aegerita]|uniref:Fungal-type protein kinase domain-containing protein n=1 Tax=Cyclocybe aegerita TaxID=1973307 RepID=A0A8S0WYR3_CYCAE|nr:unnamed protein product [Cyclocybe aegerita]
MANDTDLYWIGPKPSDKFFADHMHVKESVPAKLVEPDYFNDMPDGTQEKPMYSKLKELVDRAKLLKPTDTLVDISNSRDRNSYKGVQWRPDVGLFRTEDTTPTTASRKDSLSDILPDEHPSDHSDSDMESDTEADERSDESYVPPAEKKTEKYVNNFETNLLPFELKPNKVTPFNDPSDECQGDARKNHIFQDVNPDGVDLRGQLGAVMTEICNRQHRTRTFMVFMNVHEVRFLYHDRCATIVSEAIKYRTNSQVLAEFLWRFARLTDEQQGIDKTVKQPTDEQRDAAKKALSRWAPKKERPVVVLEVPTEDGKVRNFVMWGAMAEPKALTGRATRAYPAYDLEGKKVVFLKDTWRAAVDGMEKESDILKELNAAGVRHVPKFQYGDDIPGDYHSTVTQNDIDASWRAGPLADLCKRTHHRFTEDFVGNHLDYFGTPKELMTAINHAIIAHQDAYLNCSILHRDVSGNNVLMSDDGEGILNDWDLAKRIPTEISNPQRWAKMSEEERKADKAKIKGGRRHPSRTGTWYFMANGALRFPGKLPDIFDDMESFFWVTVFFTIQYLPCNRSKVQLANFVRDVFAQCQVDGHTGLHMGGKGKYETLVEMSTSPLSDLVFEDNNPLTKWLEDVLFALRKLTIFISYSRDDAGAVAASRAKKSGADAGSARARAITDFTVPPLPDHVQLRDHQSFLDFFTEALSESEWPNNRNKDAAVFQPPSTTVHCKEVEDIFRDDYVSSSGAFFPVDTPADEFFLPHPPKIFARHNARWSSRPADVLSTILNYGEDEKLCTIFSTTPEKLYSPGWHGGTSPKCRVLKLQGGDDTLCAMQEVDVPQKYLEQKSSPSGHILERVQSRMVALAENHLSTFEKPRDLIKSINQALTVNEAAYLKCNVIHGDVNAMNILIDPDANGVLNDWDLAKETPPPVANLTHKAEATSKAKQEADQGTVAVEEGQRWPYRNGTWYFMSNYALIFLGKEPDLYDELESFFWVTVFIILRCLPCNKRDTQLRNIVNNVFAQFQQQPPPDKVDENVLLVLKRLTIFINKAREDATALATSRAKTAGAGTSSARTRAIAKFTVPPLPEHVRLRDHRSFLQIFTAALNEPGWLENRKLPKRKRR